ncbi:MAG: hypothetical protein Barrevirus6_8 [Barrevirus sp.]|uniref:RING-type domain-containing protein n=1 Tax=Barrevirus sp. TaxID=2487763 RepID=A0A3G4ZPZ4_9VIRU|nr:MAG: hypothetical protein Barrevirus6_8 [Barrevirus sp.]
MKKYSQRDYFIRFVQSYQKDDNNIVSSYVLDKVKGEIDRRQIMNLQRNDIKNILKGLRLYKYYELIPAIHKHFIKRPEKITLDEEMECPICFEDIREAIKLVCGHIFCQICLEEITIEGQVSCSLCRKIQNVIHNYELSDADIKIILDEFTRSEDSYKVGNKYCMSFSQIMEDICGRKGIKLNQ